MQKCAVLKFGMFCLQSTKANGIRTLFEAKGNIIQSALSQLISISLFLEGEGGWELAEQ